MVVIGGVIGLELVCAYAAFGTKITVVEAMDHTLPTLDGALTKIGVAHMKKMGMAFNLECPVQAVEASPVGAKVVCRNKAGETVAFEDEKMLVAVGRQANADSLRLDACGIKYEKGRILVNEKMETNVPQILNASRKKRIAAGCGLEVVDVNRLLKQFDMMQQLTKQMTRGRLT